MTSIVEQTWKRLWENPIPIDRLAAIVTSGPKYQTLINSPNLITPPPRSVTDHRGRRSRYHLVLGLHSIKEKTYQQTKRKWPKELWKTPQTLSRRRRQIITTWNVISADGKLYAIRNQGMEAKLADLDRTFASGNRHIHPDWLKINYHATRTRIHDRLSG